MKKLAKLFTTTVIALGLMMSTASADVNDVTPSTNDLNRDSGKAYFDVIEVGPGYAEIQFFNPVSYVNCFEFRSDGDAGQSTGDNYNTDILDGLYPFTCVSGVGDTDSRVVYASQYFEVRMVFGSERDDRFDWTRVDVGQKDLCKNGAWEVFGFKNQGECIQFANTGKER